MRISNRPHYAVQGYRSLFMAGECLMNRHYRITDTSCTGLELHKYCRKNTEILKTKTGANLEVTRGQTEQLLV